MAAGKGMCGLPTAFDVDLRPPKEMGGPGGTATNPEQLFAAGYAACFESALRLVARSQRKPLKDASITARVTLNLTVDKRYLLGVELHGRLEGVSKAEAQALMRGARRLPLFQRDAGEYRCVAPGRDRSSGGGVKRRRGVDGEVSTLHPRQTRLAERMVERCPAPALRWRSGAAVSREWRTSAFSARWRKPRSGRHCMPGQVRGPGRRRGGTRLRLDGAGIDSRPLNRTPSSRSIT